MTEGLTWREADDWWALPVASRNGLQEPGVVELAGGGVLAGRRTDVGAQWGCVSTNAGRSWPPFADHLAQVFRSSPASIKRLPGSADLLAVFNDPLGRPLPLHDYATRDTPLVRRDFLRRRRDLALRKVWKTSQGAVLLTAIHFSGRRQYCWATWDFPGQRVPRSRIGLRHPGAWCLGWTADTPTLPKPPGR